MQESAISDVNFSSGHKTGNSDHLGCNKGLHSTPLQHAKASLKAVPLSCNPRALSYKLNMKGTSQRIRRGLIECEISKNASKRFLQAQRKRLAVVKSEH
jgi:hypothetical protein